MSEPILSGELHSTSPRPWRYEVTADGKQARIFSARFLKGSKYQELVAECAGRDCGWNADLICRAVNAMKESP